MYEFKVHVTIQQIFAIFYRVKFWCNDEETMVVQSSFHHLRKLFILVYYVNFVVSIALGSHTTDDNDQTIFLTVMSIVASVHNYRIFLILCKKNEIIKFVHQIGIYHTKDRREFKQISHKLELFMKFAKCFMIITVIAMGSIAIVFPVANAINNKKRMFFNNAFPMDWNESEIAFWLAFTFVVVGMFFTAVCCSIIPILWYLMLSLVFRYKILGNQFRTMGMVATEEEKGDTDGTQSLREHQSLYVQDLLLAMQSYDNINGMFEEFASTFSTMFFLQTATSAVCICGSIYNLAFISHTDLVQDGISCVIVAFLIFDIFMVMYLGNEIKLATDDLSSCMFESNWIEQSHSCKKCFMIMKERFKRPREFIVGKLYPLNLLTFTSIVNGSYSMFNLLLNFRE